MNKPNQCCCDMMRNQFEHVCDQHSDPYDCPDNLIAYTGDRYGIIIHDGGQSFIVIQFCPWCGAKLLR